MTKPHPMPKIRQNQLNQQMPLRRLLASLWSPLIRLRQHLQLTLHRTHRLLSQPRLVTVR